MPKWIVEHWGRFNGACVKISERVVEPFWQVRLADSRFAGTWRHILSPNAQPISTVLPDTQLSQGQGTVSEQARVRV